MRLATVLNPKTGIRMAVAQRPDGWVPLHELTGNIIWNMMRPALQDLPEIRSAVAACTIPGKSFDVFLPPVLRPATFRDFYAFEQHVATCRKRRGLTMEPAWYQQPVFYFSNPAALV